MKFNPPNNYYSYDYYDLFNDHNIILVDEIQLATTFFFEGKHFHCFCELVKCVIMIQLVHSMSRSVAIYSTATAITITTTISHKS